MSGRFDEIMLLCGALLIAGCVDGPVEDETLSSGDSVGGIRRGLAVIEGNDFVASTARRSRGLPPQARP